jgi:Beta protein
MTQPYRPLYCPALRMKAGELAGVRDLAPDVAACTLPRFIVPPRSERDETQPQLFVVDNAPDISGSLRRHWANRSAFIDTTYLIDEYGRDRLAAWLPQMFERARRARSRPIPMASLRDLGQEEAVAFRAAVASDGQLKFGILVSSGEMVGPEFVAAMKEALERTGLTARECAVVADFHDADFSAPELVAPIISGALESLQDLGPWHYIIFQGTHFPERNPAEHGSRNFWLRNEWNAWREAVRFDPSTAEHMMFGDYAADCAKMVFGDSGARAIRHYRYATETDWLVERGEETGSDKEIMQRVCRNIVDSGHFAGAGFSAADSYIFHTANNADGPGNATTWRQINTTHHITRAVVDIARVRGIGITEKADVLMARQMSLLP